MTAAAAGPAAGSPRRALLLMALLPFAGVFFFTLGAAFGARGTDLAILALALVTLAVALLPIISDQTRPPLQRHILISMMSLGYSGFFVVPALLFYLPESGPFSPPGMRQAELSESDIAHGQLIALTGLIALLSSYALLVPRALGQALPRLRSDWGPTAIVGVILIMMPLGWMLDIGFTFGIIPKHIFGSGFLGALTKSTFLGMSLLMIAYLRHPSRATLWLLAVLIPPTMGFNFFTASKGRFLRPIATVVITYLLAQRRLGLRWVAVGIAAIALFYPVAEFYRHGLGGSIGSIFDPLGTVERISRFVGEYTLSEYLLDGLAATSARFDGLGRASAIIRDTPERVPFQGGWTIGYIALAYIPRILWPGKPNINIGQWVTDNYGSGPAIASNTGPTWVGELYLNFGVLGVVGGMIAFGIFFRLLHEMLFRDGATVPALLAGTVVISSTVPVIGGGLVAVNRVVFALVPLVVIPHLIVSFFGGTVPLASQPTAPSPPPHPDGLPGAGDPEASALGQLPAGRAR